MHHFCVTSMTLGAGFTINLPCPQFVILFLISNFSFLAIGGVTPNRKNSEEKQLFTLIVSQQKSQFTFIGVCCVAFLNLTTIKWGPCKIISKILLVKIYLK